MKVKIVKLAIIAIVLFCCDNKKKVTPETSVEISKTTTEAVIATAKNATIEGIQWTLTMLEGHEVHKLNETDQDIHFILNPNDNRVSGFSGCNTFMGTYILESGNRIKFSKMASTRKACPIAAIDESELLNVFEMAEYYTIHDGKLMFNTKKIKSLAVFTKSEMPNDPIVEKYWKLKTLDGKDVKMEDNQEREIYFRLKAQDHSVTGFAGCNTISGAYTLSEGHRIRFKNMGTTLRDCPGVAVNEAEFLKVFEFVDNYTIANDVLSLNVGKRAPLAVFEAVYMQ